MAELVAPSRMAQRRFEKFHRKCRENCSSKRQFYRSFEVDQAHILDSGLAKNPKRLSLTNEDIAAVIQQGTVAVDRCREVRRLEIAVEGMFKDFEWAQFLENGVVAMIDPVAQVRVVIREGSPKSFIVTAYVLDPVDPMRAMPEVTREIW